LARQFILANVTATREVKRWNWFTVGLVGFADVAALPRLYAGQDLPGSLVDTGVGLELGSPLSPERRFTFVWARDWRGGANIAYVTTSLR
jgi:hypothetical protein